MTNSIKYTLAGLLLLLLTVSFTMPGDWYVFNTKGATIEFPKKPTTQVQNQKTAIGELNMEISIYDATKDTFATTNFIYALVTTEYPDTAVNSNKKENIAIFFRGAIDQAVKNVAGKILSEQAIELDGFPGRAVKVSFDNDMAVVNMRGYLVHNKLYMLQVIAETGKDQNPLLLRFLHSLKLKA
jgi:hypothetical protein